MDIFALLIGLTLAAGLILFISRPLRQAWRSNDTDSQLDALLARRESLYTQIRELDFDQATGKVVDADHAPLRARLVAEAADVLRQIDAIAGSPTASDDALEAAIAARRKRALTTTTARDALDAEVEAAIAAHRKTPTCPNCGKPIHAGDAFCSKCGAAIGTQVAR